MASTAISKTCDAADVSLIPRLLPSFTAPRCMSQLAVNHVAVGIWGCKACKKTVAGGAYTMSWREPPTWAAPRAGHDAATCLRHAMTPPPARADLLLGPVVTPARAWGLAQPTARAAARMDASSSVRDPSPQPRSTASSVTVHSDNQLPAGAG
jgi:hypothetical protein